MFSLQNERLLLKRESGKIEGMARAPFKVIFQLMLGGTS